MIDILSLLGFRSVYKVPLRDVGGMKSGVSQVEKGDTGKTLARLFRVKMIWEKTESWATDILLKASSSGLVFDALACLGAYLVGDMDYCIA